MVFDLNNKVALITGGVSGIGLCLAKELLRHGVKGVTLADINIQNGKTALDQITNEFGPNKAIFVKTDVTDASQFEDAFRRTIEIFKHIDILINNAGILDDAQWEKEVAINLNGVIQGVLLGMDNYLPKYKQGQDALIVNMSSIAGVAPFSFIPVYCATKHAILGLSKSWGTPEHYKRSKVRVIAICPGVTDTHMVSDMSGKDLGEPYERIRAVQAGKTPSQEPEFLATQVVKVMQNGENGSAWVIEGGEPAYQFIQPERSTMKR